MRTRLRVSSLSTVTLLLGLVASRQAHAQSWTAPAHVSAIEGSAVLERETGTDPAAVGVVFVPGDRLTTTAGRVEVLFPDGSALAVDEYSAIDLQSDTLLRLIEGRVLLTVAGTADPSRARRFQLDTPVATVTTDGPGEFRITLIQGRTELEAELAVLRGSASLATESGSILLRAGERSLAAERMAPTFPDTFNSARLDDFERWAGTRRSERVGPARSAQYLPSDLRMFSPTFDRYGAWSYEPSYGYVWYPVVAADWRPYHHGYWQSVPRYGWTWIGLDYWGWPTHHYGRWGFAGSRWFWVPDRRWGPAWVSWASAPGYVGWCPLGFDNRPVFALNISVGDPWRGWAVLPRTHFGSVYTSYTSHYLPARRIPPPRSFVVHDTAPVQPPRAVPRSAAFASSSGSNSFAVPRGDTRPPDASFRGSRAVNRPASVPPPAFKAPLVEPASRASRPVARTGPGTNVRPQPESMPSESAEPSANSRRGWRSTEADDRPANAPGSRSWSQPRTVPRGEPMSAPPPAAQTPQPTASSPRVSSEGMRASPRNAPSRAAGAPPPSAPPPRQDASPAPRSEGRPSNSAAGSGSRSGGGGPPAGARNSNRSR